MINIALACTAWFIITLSGLLGLLLILLQKYKRIYLFVLQFMTAVRFSTMIGDVTYHLLPHSLLHVDENGNDNGTTHHHHDPHQLMEFNVFLSGILFLYFFQIVLKIFPYTRNFKHGCHPTRVSTSVPDVVVNDPEVIDHEVHDHYCKNVHAAMKIRRTSTAHQLGVGILLDLPASNNTKIIKHSHAEESETNNHTHDQAEKCYKINKTKDVAFILLIVYMCHHIFDGIALGSTFTNRKIYDGISLAIAILFHEIPHKLGYITLLVENGYSKKNASFIVVGTSTVSLIGVVIGCKTAFSLQFLTVWIYLFTSGMFIYISLVLVMPEMLNAIMKKELHIFFSILSQFLGIITGFGIMFGLAQLETYHQ